MARQATCPRAGGMDCPLGRLPLWVAACALLAPLCWGSLATALDLDLRLEWGGGEAHGWVGRISLEGGRVSNPHALGIEADEPGSMWEANGAVEIGPRAERTYDGVDVSVSGPATSKLVIALRGSHEDAPKTEVTVPLSQLISGSEQAALDGAGNTIVVRRAPGDKMRVEFARDHLVFDPGEQCRLEVRPHAIDEAAGTRLRMHAWLSPARGTKELWASDSDLVATEEGAENLPLAVPLPTEEGVYDLHLSLHRRNLPRRLGLRQIVADRKIQLVVISPTSAASTSGPEPTDVVVEIDPANPGWWQRLTTVSWLPGARRGPISSGDSAPWTHSLGTLVQLGAGRREQGTSWEAYPLPITRTGQPHIIEVEYPSDVPQSLGLSIVEPNAAGAVVPIGVDSGVYVPDEAAAQPARMLRHRLVYWPRTKLPLLLITNRREGSRAVYGKIRVLGPRESTLAIGLPAGLSPPPAVHLPATKPAIADAGAPQRLVAAYFDRPLFTENFAATETFDDYGSRSLDDWQTFYEGAMRLVEYLRYAGYNGVLLTVYADGSSIYPSQLLQPTPRYDTGALLSSGQDPLRKDVLEMLFRIFDREGLRLVPAVQFAAPLPELEQTLRGADVSPGLRLVDADGAPWQQTHAVRRGLAPYYNPLDARAQAAMQAAVREVALRYGQHTAYGGIALQCSGDGFSQLPGEAWPLDPTTLGRFARDARLPVDAELPALVTGTKRTEWLTWRAQQLAAFHTQLRAEATAGRPGTRFYLSCAELFDAPQWRSMLQPALPKQTSPLQVLLAAGLDPKLSADDAELVFLRPARVGPRDDLVSQGPLLELNDSAELDAAAGDEHPGQICFASPQPLRLSSFDSKSPHKHTFTWLVTQSSPSGEENRRSYAHGLQTLDAQTWFDGGWLLPLGQEAETREVRLALQALPAVKFKALPDASTPITARIAEIKGATFTYLVNDSPWPAEFTVQVACSPQCKLESLGAARHNLTLGGSGGLRTWTAQLKPYDVLVAHFSESVKLSEPVAKVDNRVSGELAQRIRDLGARAASLQSGPAAPLLANPSFEDAAADNATLPAGWTSNGEVQQAALDNSYSHGGKRSVVLRGTPNGYLTSTAIQCRTGRLAVSVWLRAPATASHSVLRLGIESTGDDPHYYRYAAVDLQNAPAAGAEWTRYYFEVVDLPGDRGPLRVRFDLQGDGDDRVWLDDVEANDLQFSPEERKELSNLIILASVKLQAGQFAECQRVLDGYWPRFLTSMVPLSQVEQPQPSAPPARPTVKAQKSGPADWVRRMLPPGLR